MVSKTESAAAEQEIELDEEDHTTEAQYYNCRFFRNKIPEVGQITMVETVQIKELGATVILLEYGNIEGFIQFT